MQPRIQAQFLLRTNSDVSAALPPSRPAAGTPAAGTPVAGAARESPLDLLTGESSPTHSSVSSMQVNSSDTRFCGRYASWI